MTHTADNDAACERPWFRTDAESQRLLAEETRLLEAAESEHTADNDALLRDEDGPYLPGHRDVSYDLGTPRQFTARGGWNVRCECGAAFAETGDDDFDARWLAHLTSVIPPEGTDDA